MSAPLLAALTLVPFYFATLATDAMPARLRWLPLGLLCALSFAAMFELTRFDHGHAEVLFLVGTLGAPIGAILGGAAWGTRRFYGWPDLGPHPSRLGLWCAVLLLGVLAGTRQKADDVAVSQARGDDLARRVLAWREAHPGATPASLEAAVPDAPRTRMGWIAPPPYALHVDAAGALALELPVSSTVVLRRPIASGEWARARVGAEPPR
jgi:hypothetical protein